MQLRVWLAPNGEIFCLLKISAGVVLTACTKVLTSVICRFCVWCHHPLPSSGRIGFQHRKAMISFVCNNTQSLFFTHDTNFYMSYCRLKVLNPTLLWCLPKVVHHHIYCMTFSPLMVFSIWEFTVLPDRCHRRTCIACRTLVLFLIIYAWVLSQKFTVEVEVILLFWQTLRAWETHTCRLNNNYCLNGAVVI